MPWSSQIGQEEIANSLQDDVSSHAQTG